MNIKKRFILSNIIIVMIPLIITILYTLSFLYINLKITGNKVDYTGLKQNIFMQSELMNIRDDVSKIINNGENKKEIYKILNNKLSIINGNYVYIKSDKIISNPKQIGIINIQKFKDILNNRTLNKSIKIDDHFYMVQSINIPKSNENIIMFAPIIKNTSGVKTFFISIIVVFIIAFIITNIIMSIRVSKKIIEPITLMKKATKEIRNGNLDYNITEEGDEEIKELCYGFEAMRIQLKNSIDMKMKYESNRKGLISSISHDLKTPITSIKGYVEGIMDGIANTPDKMDRYLRTIYSKSISMDHMIDDLLLYSKLDLNSVPFNFQKVDIYNFFKDCVYESKIELEKSNIDLTINSNLKKCVTINIDIEKMKRVVLNIISNSKKYMDKENGKINISIREKNVSIIVEIRDNGPGVDEKDINKIFDRFYRTDIARSGAKGSGLGLAIAKQIVEGNHGKIWAINHEKLGISIMMSFEKT